MPQPMTAPMPSEVRLGQPNDFLSRSFESICVGDELVDVLGTEELWVQLDSARATQNV